MEDQQQQHKVNKSKWLQWLIMIAVFLLLAFIIVFPPVFSKLILRPAIVQGFSQATSNQYQIEFSQLKWNLLSRKIDIEDLKIRPTNDLMDTTNFFQLELDQLSLDKIHYFDLLDGSIRLKSLILDSIQLKNHGSFSDSIQPKQQLDIPFLKSLFIDNVQLNLKSILLLKSQDSMVFLQKGQVKIEQLQWDSIANKARLNWPIINQLSASFKKMDYQKDHKMLNFQNFKISENRLSNFNMLFEKINYRDLERNHSISVKWPSLELDSLQRIEEEGIWRFDINRLIFEADSLLNVQPVPALKKPLEIKKSIMQIADDLGVEIIIDSILLKTKFNELKTSTYNSQLKNIDAKMAGFNLSHQVFDLYNFGIHGEKQTWILNKSGDSFGFDEIHLSNDHLSLYTIYVHPFHRQYSFEASAVELAKIDMPRLIFNEKLVANRLLLTRPTLELKEKQKSAHAEFKSPLHIEIDSLQLVDGDLNVIPENLNIHSFDFNLSKLMLNKGKKIYLDSIFSDFYFRAAQLKYKHSGSFIDIDASGLKIRSKNEFFQIRSLKLEESNSSIPAQFEFSNLSIAGFNWRKIYRNISQWELGSFYSDSIRIAGELSTLREEDKDKEKKDIGLYIQNVDLPNIELDLQMEKAGKNRKLYFEKLQLLTSSFNYQSTAEKPITVGDLVLHSSFSSFSENLDSLLITSSEWNFNSANDSWESKHIFIQKLYAKDLIRSKSETKIKIPQLSVSGLNPYDYLVDKKVKIDSLMVLSPEVSFSGERMTQLPKLETKNWNEELREIVEKFVFIDFNYVKLEKADLVFNNNYLGRRDQLSIKEVDVNMREFYLDYQSLQNWDRFAFSKEFSLEFKNYFFNINNGTYLFDIQKGAVNSDDRSLKLNNISFLSLYDTLSVPINFQVKQLTLKDFYLNATSSLPSLNIGLLSMDQPTLQLKQKAIVRHSETKNGLETINLYNGFKDYLSSVELDTFDIRNLGFDYLSAWNDYDLKDIDISANGIQIDKDNHIFTDKKFLYSNHLELVLPQFNVISKNRFYHYQMQNIKFISSNKQLMLDSLKITSRYDRKTFSANLKFQKDQIDALIPHIEVSNIDIRDAVFRERFKADKIDIYQPGIWIFKDKTIKPDTSAYRYMPAQLLSELQFYVHIDTAQVHNAFLQYEEFNHMMTNPGKVFFTDINSRITGISNDKDLIEFGGAIKLLANGKMMSKSNLSLTAVFPLNSPKQDFVMLAAMDQLNAKELNPLIQPLTLLSAKEGSILNMQMNVKGNNDYAYGEMLLKYEDLKVEVLNKNLKESGLASFLANSFMIRKNNKNFLFPRKGPIYYDRITYRSFIHYMIHFAIVGTKTSLGVDKRKTLRKVDEVEFSEE